MNDVEKLPVTIANKIVAVRIKDTAATVEVSPSVSAVVDENPLTRRIESRPQGSLQAVAEKISYTGSEGRKKVYLIVSFMPVQGRMAGTEVTIERPVEFFIPSGQLSSEHQWITATMRSLSLAARGGYITQALADLRKVAWDKGPVRCGENRFGKPMYHDSEVAAIAWSIQKVLHQRGFLDEEGNQVAVDSLIALYRNECTAAPATVEVAPEVTLVLVKEEEAAEKSKYGNCTDCGGELILLDGCPTCTSCGWSKCG